MLSRLAGLLQWAAEIVPDGVVDVCGLRGDVGVVPGVRAVSLVGVGTVSDV